MSEKKSFLNEEYTQLITEIRTHLWLACTKYNNEMPRELKDLLGSIKVPCAENQYNIHENMVHVLDHMDKLLTKINIDPSSVNTEDIDLGIDNQTGVKNVLWLLTFTVDNGATWHEYNAIVKAPTEDIAKQRLEEISWSLGNESYIPSGSITAKCIDNGDFICFSTIPHSEFKK